MPRIKIYEHFDVYHDCVKHKTFSFKPKNYHKVFKEAKQFAQQLTDHWNELSMIFHREDKDMVPTTIFSSY